MMYDLPTSVNVNGTEYEIRSDYRAALDICAALSDNELEDTDKIAAVLAIFYPGVDDMPVEDFQKAIKQCFWFIDCGDEEQNRKAPKLMDWEQDFKYIVAPINRVCGQEIRAVKYDFETNTGGLHWWTFISAYYEIGGNCMFANIVRIREQLAKGKALDKSDKEWYLQNKNLVDFKDNYTRQESELLNQWIK